MTPLSPAEIEFIPSDYFREISREELFPDNAKPLELDVGCGDGTFLLQMAAHYPERLFLGIERLGGRIRKFCRHAARRGLRNVRVIHLESSYTLSWLLPAGCASRIHLLFPDPWPKKRHAFRRFVHPENLAGLHRVMAPGAELLFKTDHEDYFNEAVGVIDNSPLFERLPWQGPEEFYPITDFEHQWLTQGKNVHAARWARLIQS